MPARAPVVVAAEQALVERLRERGHPFARVAERKTFINRDLDEMTVQLAVNAGPPGDLRPSHLQRSRGRGGKLPQAPRRMAAGRCLRSARFARSEIGRAHV